MNYDFKFKWEAFWVFFVACVAAAAAAFQDITPEMIAEQGWTVVIVTLASALARPVGAFVLTLISSIATPAQKP